MEGGGVDGEAGRRRPVRVGRGAGWWRAGRRRQGRRWRPSTPTRNGGEVRPGGTAAEAADRVAGSGGEGGGGRGSGGPGGGAGGPASGPCRPRRWRWPGATWRAETGWGERGGHVRRWDFCPAAAVIFRVSDEGDPDFREGVYI